jgi:hypothetical protein
VAARDAGPFENRPAGAHRPDVDVLARHRRAWRRASSFSNFWSLGGFYLTDPTTSTEYIPVYQASGEPLTAPLSNNMAPGETYPV